MTRRLRFILLESPLELVPRQLWNHPQVINYAKRFNIEPWQTLLDKTYHYHAMASLTRKWKRGRPDIVHVTLLVITESIPALKGLVEVYIHVIDGRVFRVKPGTRIPKHLDRFKGLMAQLLHHNQVPPDTENPLIYKVADTLAEFTKRHGGIILLHEKGEEKTPREIAREALETGAPLGIGMFPRGDFQKSTLRKAAKRYRIHGGIPLKAWTVAAEILCGLETLLQEAEDKGQRRCS